MEVVPVISLIVLVSLVQSTWGQVLTQQQIDHMFAEHGVDNYATNTARARHTVFVGSSESARKLGWDYKRRMELLEQSQMPDMPDLRDTGTCANQQMSCDRMSEYRTIDGSCNNLNNPTWGQSMTPLRRLLPAQYHDGKMQPRGIGVDGSPLPSPRLVSTTVHQTDAQTPKLTSVSHMLMQFGQFLDHDFALSPIQTGEGGRPLTCCAEDVPPELRAMLDVIITRRDGCFPIGMPENDPHFTIRKCMHFPRSILVNNAQCTGYPAEQLNMLTAYIDASQIYGSVKEEEEELRTHMKGQLKLSQFDLLPVNNDTIEVCSDKCYLAGDERANEQIGLTSMHTLFSREHNRMARILCKLNPGWDDEKIFQETRKIMGAIIQKITYEDFLPLVLGRTLMNRFGLTSSGFPTNVYDASVDASIVNSFAAAAYRFGHSLLRTMFSRLRQDYSPRGESMLRDLFANTALYSAGCGQAVGDLLRGEVFDRSSTVDRFMTPEVTNFLFATDDGQQDSMDLASLNIQRGRDHGLPSYAAFREFCGLSPVTTWQSLVNHDGQTIAQFRQPYKDPRDIDLFTGALSEMPVDGGLVGPTFACILANQFSRLKRGDRFWYESNDPVTGFTPQQLREIKRSSLSRLLCDNTDTKYVQRDAFQVPSLSNHWMFCDFLPRVNMYMWKEGAKPWSIWNLWHK